ncbi:MAG TPA: PASTA domain-containing protein [Cyclobacteriaceae bacterium]|jgi:hypothetical protein
MNWFQTKTWVDLVRHLFLIFVIVTVLVLGLFYIYLPAKTNHGEAITVPDLIGLNISDLDKFLVERNLRYEINDSSYDHVAEPLTVLQQFPKPGVLVKEDRKIYLTINRKTPPEIRLPASIIGYSLKNAEAVLTSYELLRGKITYVPYPYSNLVLEMKLQGKNLYEGNRVPKGSAIDLVVGDGYGKRKFAIDDLTRLTLDDAKIYLNGSGLKLGIVTGQKDSTDTNWIVSKQIPLPNDMVSIGQFVDIWVAPLDSLNNEPLDE